MPRPWRLTAPRLTENDVEAQCKTILALHGYTVYRLNAGLAQSLDAERIIPGARKGTPDYVCLHGRHELDFLLEVKRPGGTLNPNQLIEIPILREKGLTVVVVDHVDKLCDFLAQHERSP